MCEFLAVDFGPRDEDALRDELAVDGVPVDVLLVPVLLLLFAEDHPEGFGFAGGGDHQDDVVLLEGLVRRGDRDPPVAPDARDDEAVVALHGDVVDAPAEERRIGDVVAGDEDVLAVFCIGPRQVRGADEEAAQEGDGQNHPHDAQRIGDGTAQRRAAVIEPQLFEHLLCGSQRRGVGRCAAQDARHVGHRDAEQAAHAGGCGRTEEHEPDGRGEEPQPVGAHRTEKARSDLQTEGIDEDDESETLGVGQHRRVEFESEVPGENSREEDEGRAEGDSEEADLPQTDSDCGDQRYHHDGLQGRGFEEQVFEPFHRWGG